MLTEAPTMAAGTGGFSGGATATGACCWFWPRSDFFNQTPMPTYRIRYCRRSTDDWSYWTDLQCVLTTVLALTLLHLVTTKHSSMVSTLVSLVATSSTTIPASGSYNNDAEGTSQRFFTCIYELTGDAKATTAASEALGESGTDFREMGFSIEKVTVTARPYSFVPSMFVCSGLESNSWSWCWAGTFQHPLYWDSCWNQQRSC